MGGWRIHERGLVQGRWLNTPWVEGRTGSFHRPDGRGCILNNESWEPPVKASARERGCKGACATHTEASDGPRQACQRRLPFPQSHPKAPGLEGRAEGRPGSSETTDGSMQPLRHPSSQQADLEEKQGTFRASY